VPNFVQIGTPAAEIWRHINFQDNGRQPCCICFGVMADHPRSAFRGLNSDLKSLVRRINCSGERIYCDVKILAFWLETAYSRPFLGSFWGILSPWRHQSSWPPKGTSLGGNTSFEPFSVRISATVRPGCVTEKKQYNKNLTKVLYFPYLGGSPRWADSTLKLHGGWCPRHNHMCQVSNWNLHWLRFYRRSNFRFSYWF